MSKTLKWIVGIVGALVVLLLAVFVVAALVPGETDPPVDVATSGAGSSSVVPT